MNFIFHFFNKNLWKDNFTENYTFQYDSLLFENKNSDQQKMKKLQTNKVAYFGNSRYSNSRYEEIFKVVLLIKSYFLVPNLEFSCPKGWHNMYSILVRAFRQKNSEEVVIFDEKPTKFSDWSHIQHFLYGFGFSYKERPQVVKNVGK